MRKIVLEAFGGPEVLEVKDWPEPECPADGYVVEVRAAGINYADVVERRGRYRADQKLPYELGKEASGVVVERGPDATELSVGDRVIVAKMANGCYAERVAASPTEVLPARDGLSFEQLAAYPIAYATAWYSLMEMARVRPGESVLIHAAAGGVGIAAVRLAKAFGCAPILGTAGSAAKCAWVVENGADACVDYTKDDFREAVKEHTGGRGVDCIVDSISGQVFEHGLEVLAEMGRIVVMGFASIREDFGDKIKRLHPIHLFHRSIAVAGLNVSNLDFPARREIWGRMDRFVAEHGLEMTVGHTFPLEEAAAAQGEMERRLTHGKILLLP